MTNSTKNYKVAVIIDEIFELLDADFIHQTIDGPIEEAVESFEFDSKAPMTVQNFFKITGDFIAHLCRFGPGVRKILSATQARSKALSIIENCYWHCSEDIRLDAAYLDAADNETAGIEYVLEQMANYIKDKARQIHVEWVFTTRLRCLDWKIKCSIAKAFIHREKPYIPSELLACHPAQLTHNLDDLMKLFVDVDSKLPK
jgi:hypothetical protein